MDTLGKILQLLKSKGLDQKALSDYLGISHNTVTEWKKGRNKSYKKHIDKIAEFFEVTTDYLLNDEISDPFFKDIKKESLVKYQAILKLYQALIEIDFIQPNETITDEKLELLTEFILANKAFIQKLLKDD